MSVTKDLPNLFPLFGPLGTSLSENSSLEPLELMMLSIADELLSPMLPPMVSTQSPTSGSEHDGAGSGFVAPHTLRVVRDVGAS